MNNPSIPAWLRDIQSYVDSIAFGEVDFKIQRGQRKTNKIETVAVETIIHPNNPDALDKILQLLESLEKMKFSGTTTFTVDFKDGKIKQTGYYTVKQTHYNG